MERINTRNFVLALFMAVAMFVAFVPSASALSYVPNDYHSQRQALLDQIQVLLAEIMRLDNSNTYYYTYTPSTSYGGGRVLGTSLSYGLAVNTLNPKWVTDDRAEVYGDVDLNGESYAYVWFEYGETTSMNKDTRRERVDRYDNIFYAELSNLRDDERYYYRAVAERPGGSRVYGHTLSFDTLDGGRSSSRHDDEPEADTYNAEDIDRYDALLRGRVDMNDFRNGRVFFVYGEDENQIEDVERDYDTYTEVDEDGDDLQKVSVDSDLDGRETYEKTVYGLDRNTDHYYTICVQYEDDDDDDRLVCGNVEHFETN